MSQHLNITRDWLEARQHIPVYLLADELGCTTSTLRNRAAYLGIKLLPAMRFQWRQCPCIHEQVCREQEPWGDPLPCYRPGER